MFPSLRVATACCHTKLKFHSELIRHLETGGHSSGWDLNDRKSSQFTEKQEVIVAVIITGVGVKNYPKRRSGQVKVTD